MYIYTRMLEIRFICSRRFDSTTWSSLCDGNAYLSVCRGRVL